MSEIEYLKRILDRLGLNSNLLIEDMYLAIVDHINKLETENRLLVEKNNKNDELINTLINALTVASTRTS